MADNGDSASQERRKGWYRDDITEVNEPIRKLLEEYSKVPGSEVVKHVNKIVSMIAYRKFEEAD